MKRMKIENRARSSYNSLSKSISLLIILLSILMTSSAKSSELSFEEYQRSINPNNFKYLINGKADSEINQFERYSKLFIGGSETVKTRPTRGLATETKKDVKSISSASLDTNKNKTNVLATLKPALHTDKVVTNVKSDSVNSKPFETLHYTGQHEKEMYNEILEKPIVLLGEPTMITSCPHDWNNEGLCQRIFIKTISEDGLHENYEPHYSCACRENFKGQHCQECAGGFFGQNWYPCPHDPADFIICGTEGIWDDGIEGTGRCAWLDSKNDPDIFCSGAGQHSNHHEDEVLTFGFIVLVLVALWCTMLLYLYHKYQSLHIFPESVAAILFGIFVGLFIKYYYQSNNLMRILSFEPHTFFLFLLPPIMFEAGFSLKSNIFFRSFLTISAYAVIATFLASIIFTLIFYYGASLTKYPFFFIESFQFGCFISAIDPVATISIFKSLRVSEKLYMIVFGESALNDAVSIALAQSAENVGFIMQEGESIHPLEIVGGATLHFFLYFVGSIFVGALWGLLVSYIFAKFDFHLIPWIEIGLFFILSYFPYVLSEGIGLSGILAILTAAIFLRNHAFHWLSPIGQVTVESMVEMTCNISENFVFAYMGLSVPMTLATVKFELIGIAIVALLVSRAGSVIITSYFVNIFRKDKIPWSYQAIMSFSGLRGAVAFYLALNVNSEYKHLIITTTIGLIIFTIIGLGSTTTWLLKAMAKYFPEDGIFHNEEGEDLLVRREHGYSGMSDSLYDRNEGGRGVEQEKSIGVVTRLERFDQELGRKYLRKDGWQDFLGGENDDMKYDEEYVVSPDRGRYYDNLSNYQFSVMKHLEETSPNLPYEDRKSVRLSVMSNRNEPGKNSFLNPNRKRVGNNTREEYERQMQLSKRGERPFGLSVRKEQMSIMSEPRGRPSGMKKISGFNIIPVATEDTSKRLNVPPININIGGLDDISSKGSQAESKIEKKNEESKQEKADQISKDTKNNTGTELLPAKPVQKVQFKEPERPQEINKSEEKVADQSKEESSKETGEKLKTTDRKTEEENNENNDKI